jgi:methylthioribose-1-phosphate isomerase
LYFYRHPYTILRRCVEIRRLSANREGRGLRLTPIRWSGQRLEIIDQSRLPGELRWVELCTLDEVMEAIRRLWVRGAPAIGCCAAFGLVRAVREAAPRDVAAGLRLLGDFAPRLSATRPTAVNLAWAVDRMVAAAQGASQESLGAWLAALEQEAERILEEDQAAGRAIGEHGAGLIPEGGGVLTYCNAGGLATSGYGTALSPMFVAHGRGRRFGVYACETRPLLQGARLTAFELREAGIPVTLICDNMAGRVMQEGRVQVVLVGADRIAGNGDTANKIGTYALAVLARAHGIPFYVAAPHSTFDLAIETGEQIPIEEREASEVTAVSGVAHAPAGVSVYNPAFDITPAALISGFVTESGVILPPYEERLLEVIGATAASGQVTA